MCLEIYDEREKVKNKERDRNIVIIDVPLVLSDLCLFVFGPEEIKRAGLSESQQKNEEKKSFSFISR